MDAKILIVDDEIGLLEMIHTFLTREGFKQVVCVSTATEALDQVQTEEFDLILLDVGLPDMDGFTLCAKMRSFTHAPILFLTSRANDLDKLMGFGVGADDYITKPFHMLELLARIKAPLRRKQLYLEKSNWNHEHYDCGRFQVNATSGQLFVGGKEVSCTPKEFLLLRFFCRHPNRIFSVEQLYEQVWEQPYMGEEKTVAMVISRVRKKIEKDPKQPQYIVTVRGLGYKFVMEK